MVLWLVLLGAQLLFGFQLSKFCFSYAFPFLVVVAMAVPTGIGISSISYFATCWIFGHNNLHILIHIALLIALSILLFRRNQDRSLGKFSVGDAFVFTFFFVASCGFSRAAYPTKPRSLLRTTIPYLYEEFAIKSSFTYGANSGHFSPFRLVHPAQNGKTVVTRWFTAFHSSMLEMSFASERSSIAIPSLLFLLAFMLVTYSLAAEVKLPRIWSCTCPFVVMFAAGYAFCDIRKGPDGNHQLDYVSRTRTAKTIFLHPTLHFFIALRSTPFALTICASVFLFILKLGRSINLMTDKACVLLGVLVGTLLPALNSISFVSISVFVWISFLLHWRNGKMAIAAFGVSYLIGSALHAPTLVRFAKTWTWSVFWQGYVKSGHYFPFLFFWFDCYGGFFLVALAISWLFVNKNEMKALLALILTFFVLSQFQMHKTLGCSVIAVMFGVLPLASVFFVLPLYRLSKIANFPEEVRGALTAFAILVMAVTCASGAAGFGVQLREVYEYWDEDDIALGKWVRANTTKDDVFLTSFQKMPPETTFAGRTSFIAPKHFQDIVEFNSSDEQSELEWFCTFTDNDEYLTRVTYFVKDKGDSDECRYVILNEDSWKEVYENKKVSVFHRVK